MDNLGIGYDVRDGFSEWFGELEGQSHRRREEGWSKMREDAGDLVYIDSESGYADDVTGVHWLTNRTCRGGGSHCCRNGIWLTAYL